MSPAHPLALSFDLDDTLWPNRPVILRAEQLLREWLQTHAPATAGRFPLAEMRRLRAEVGLRHPELAHDLSQLRLITTREALTRAGEDPALAERAFEIFMSARQDVTLYDDVIEGLRRLASRYPLLALSNGNADVAKVGLGDYFVGSVSARQSGFSKPDARIFLSACDHLGLAPAQVMHVGDDWTKDVKGARDAGLHSAWLRRGDAADRFEHSADDPDDETALRTAPPGRHCVLPDLRALADELGC